jgi:hypothetical protein
MTLQKIAVWPAVGAAFAFVFLHPLRLLRLGGLWLALILALLVLSAIVSSPSVPRGPVTGPAVAAFVVGFFVAGIVLLGGFYSFWVALHRAALVGEIRPWFAALRFGRREWRFVGYSILISILMGLPLLPVELVAVPLAIRYLHTGGNIFVMAEWGSVMATVLTLVVWTYGSRLFLVFAAVAADETGDKLSRAWARSRGNGFRIYIGSVICLLPFIVGHRLVQWLRLRDIAEALRTKEDIFVAANHGTGLYGTVSFVILLVGLAVLVGFSSYCYLRLTPPASAAVSDAPQPAPAPAA